MRYFLGLFFISLLLFSCQEKEEQQQPDLDRMEALCECVGTKTPEGKWDMHLSPECINLCVQMFGSELKGMEEWFRNHCGFDMKHPDAKEKSKEVSI